MKKTRLAADFNGKSWHVNCILMFLVLHACKTALAVSVNEEAGEFRQLFGKFMIQPGRAFAALNAPGI